MIKLIVGLGNPGQRYQKTRHNAGFWFLDKLVEEIREGWREESRFQSFFASTRIDGGAVYFIKPQGFMNRSGQAVGAVARYFKIEAKEILVVHDELDFAPGVVKLKGGGGHGGHNGLRDIIANLGVRDFNRLRIGIGHPGDRRQVTDYVLAEPSKAEQAAIIAALTEVVKESGLIFVGDFDRLMNKIHK